jgi:CRP/FNR family transcriptional regulator, cyclic AMP receptor protein
MKKLSLIEKAFFLKKTSIFKDLDLDMLLSVADKLNQDVYDANEDVFKKGQKGNKIYFIADGDVDIIENELILKKLKKTDFFGDETLFNEMPRSYHALCKSNCLILTLSKSSLMTIISECPHVAIILLKKYSKNITYAQE